MAHKCIVLLIVALATSRALAGPLSYFESDSTECSSECPVNTKFSFEPDQTYEYRYESDVKTHMGGVSEEHSSLHLRATAQIEVASRCELVLRLSDVSLQDSKPTRYESRDHVERLAEFKAGLEARGTRFSWQDGQVAGVCPDQEEPVWALNVKRAVLSTLQNTMDSLDDSKRVFETDVAGTCPTDYEAEGKSWRTLKVKKTKDLLGCMDRNGPHTAFEGMPFNIPSDIQSLPIMKSTHECEQSIKDGIITAVECAESHVFRPFSRQENGARTEVTSKLTFYRKFSGVQAQQSTQRVRSTLLFDHTLSAAEREQTMTAAKAALAELCTLSQNDIRPEVPATFTRFVRECRRLESDDLARLFQMAPRVCSKAEKFFRDAIPLIGSEASVDLIARLITSGQAQDMEAEIWLTSISTSIHRPTKQMITALTPLLQRDASRKTFLSLSSLINNYCHLATDCDEDRDIQAVISLFEARLSYNCRLEREDQHDEILMSLKALGNAGHASRAVPTLARCAANTDLPMELRVAALQAFRRMPCMADRTELFRLFEDTHLDSELRIHAYITLMACADDATLARVVRLLESEQINQVGSFIWTHLTNLQETSNPHKQQIRDILENQELKATFDMDKRKFSRNIEWSLFSELINMGGSVESNILFSENSYVPRSAMVNLTIDVFGQSVNLFEMGGRMQGMESLLERFFGPESEMGGRSKRAVIRDDAINMLDRAWSAERDGPSMSYFLRMFGNEIRYGDLHNFDMSGLQDKFNFLEFLIKLSEEHEFEVTKSLMFLDVDHVIPTIAGMPLRLEADGSASINVAVQGKMDIRRMFTSPSNFDISGSVRPSAAVEVTSQMGVDAFVARTGLKMVTTLHTSTVAQGKFQLGEGRVFNLDVDVPQDKMEIISAESKFYVVWRESEREQNMLTPAKATPHCVGGRYVQATGLQLCGELSYPTSTDEAPFFPFTGPVSAKVYLTKEDTYTGFHFEAKYVQEKTRSQNGMLIKDIGKVSFNTPGSQVDREMTAEFTLDRANKDLNINLVSPWKRATVNAEMQTTETLRRVFARAIVDQTKEYSFSAQVQTEDRGSAINYQPNVEIVIPGRKSIILDGAVTLRQNRKYDVDMRLKNLFSTPISLQGSVDKLNNRRRMKYGGVVELRSSLLQGKLEGFVDRNMAESGQSLASRLTMEYSYNQGPAQSVVLSNKIRDQSTDEAMSYSLDTAWRSTFFPRYDGEVSLDFSKSANQVQSTLQAGLDDVRKIIFTETVTYQLGPNTQVQGTARFQFPLKHMDYEATVEHRHNTAMLNTQGTIKYAENHEASASLNLQRESVSPMKMSGVGRLSYPGREMAWSQSIEEKAPREYHHNLNIQLQKYENIQLESVYKMRPMHELTATLAIPEMQPLTLTAKLNPRLPSLLAHVDVNVFGRSYLVESTLAHQGSLPAFNTRGTFTLAYPGRKVQAAGTVSRQNAVVSTDFETTWAPEQKVTIQGSVTLAKAAPALTLKLTWPRNFANLEFDGAFQHQGWYETEDDLQASVKFTSSLPRMEALSATLKHDLTTAEMKTLASVSWAQGRKVDLTFTRNKIRGNSNVKYAAQMNTPYAGFRTMSGELTYNLEGTTLQSSTKAQWENNLMSLVLGGEVTLAPSRLLRGTVTFTSPFRGFETISASARHTDNGRAFSSNLMTSWAQNQQIEARFTMNHDSSRGIKNVGEVSVMTPFSVFRSLKSTWNHEHTDSRINTHAELDKDGERGVFDLEGSMKRMGATLGLGLKSSLETPWTDFKLNGDIEGESGPMMHKHTADVTFSWARNQAISYEGVMDFAADHLNMKAKYSCPFSGVTTLDMANTIQPGRYVMSNTLTYGNNKKMAFESNGYMQGMDTQATARFESACPYLQRIILNMKNTYENGIYSTHKDLEYAPGKIISIDTRLGLEAEKMFSLALKTPFNVVRDLGFVTKFDGVARRFVSDTTLTHNMLASPIGITMKADTADLKNIETLINLETPFAPARSVKAAFSHSRNNGGRVQNKLSLQTPQYEGSVTSDIRVRGWNWHTSQIDLEYMSGQKITFSHEFTTSPKIEGKAMLVTPFDNLRSMALTFNHEGVLTAFRSEAQVEYNGYHVNGDAQFQLQGTEMNAAAKIESAYNLMAISASHKGDYSEFTNNVAVNFNGKQLTGSTEFNLRDMQPTGKITINTPYEMCRSLNLNFEHQGKNWRNFENSVEYEFNGQRYTGSTEFKWYGRVLRAKARVNIPREYSIKISHKGDMTEFTNSLALQMARESVEAATAWKVGPNMVDASATATTSFQGYDKFEMTVKHDGPGNDFKTSAFVVTPFPAYRRMGAEVTHSFTDRLSTMVTLTTPCTSAPVITLALTHAGPASAFTTTASAEYSGKKIESVVSFSLSPKVEGSARLTTPYTGLEKFAVGFSHEGVATNFRTSATVETPFRGFERMFTEYNHNGDMQAFNCNYKLETSHPSARSINMVLSHSMPGLNRLESSLAIDTTIPGFDRLAMEINHNGDYMTMRSSGSLTTPFAVIRRASYNIDHDVSNYRNMRSAVTVTMPQGETGYAFTYEGYPAKFTSGLTISTPIPGHNRYELTFDHTGRNAERIDSSARLVTPSGNYGYSLTHNGPASSFETVFEVTTPYYRHERYALALSHNSRSLESIRTSATLTTPTGPFTASLTHNGQSDNFRSLLEVTTPLPGYAKYSANMDHSHRDLSDISSSAQLVSPHGEFSYNFNHKGQPTNFRTSITATSPFQGYNRYSLSINHNQQNPQDISSNAKLLTAMGNFAYDFTFKGVATRFTSGLTVNTPFTGFETYSLNMDHSNTGVTAIETSSQLNTPHGEFAYSFEHNGVPTRFTTSMSVRNPFSGPYSLNIQHSNTGVTAIDCSSQLRTPYGEFSYTLNHNGQPTNFKTSLSVRNPFTQEVSMNIEHANTGVTDIKTSSSINTPFGVHSFAFSHDGVAKNFRCSLTMDLPVMSNQRLTAELTHNCQNPTDISSSAKLAHGSSEMTYSFSHRGDLSNMATTLEITTPFQAFNRFQATLNHRSPSAQDITSELRMDTPFGAFSINVEHNGHFHQANSKLAVTTPFPGYNRFAIDVVHSSENLNRISSNVKVTIPMGEFAYELTHEGTPTNFNSRLTLKSPFRGYETMSGNIEHRAESDIANSASVNTPWGTYSYEFTHSGVPSNFRTGLKLMSPFWSTLSGSLTHSAPSLSNINCNFNLQSDKGTIVGEFTHNGIPSNFKTNVALSLPISGYERWATAIEHSHSTGSIKSTSQVTTPYGVFSYDLSHNGRPTQFRSSLAVATPFRGYEQMSGSVELTAPSLRDIKHSASITSPWGVFGYDLEHSGVPANFRTTFGINTPFAGHPKYTLTAEHNGERYSDITTSLRLVAPRGTYSTGVTYNGVPQNFRGTFSLATPHFSTVEVAMQHEAADWSKIASSATATTPFGEFRYNLAHSGALKAARSSFTVNTPFNGYESQVLSLDYDVTNPRRIQAALEFTGSITNMGARFSHRGSWANIRSELEITTPIPGHQRYQINLEHAARTVEDIKTNVQLATPVGVYTVDFKHDGTPLRFTNVFTLTTPHSGYEQYKQTTTLNAEDLRNIAFSWTQERPTGKYSFEMSHSGVPTNFRTTVEVTTPHTPYNRFTGTVTFALTNTVAFSTEVTTSIPSYERFGVTINHEGNAANFKTTGEATTSVPGYNRFGFSAEHSGGLQTPKTVVGVQTPFPGHTNYVATVEKSGTLKNLNAKAQVETPHGTYGTAYSHSGRPTRFQAEGSITTPQPGYDRFGFEINHNGDANRLRTSAQVMTPFQNYQRFGMQLNHNLNAGTLRSGLTVNTAIPGFEEWSTEVRHEGGLDNFNTDFKVNTPIPGYNNFGINMNHGGNLNQFQSRGTVTLPFQHMPAVTLSVNHDGTIRDFRTSGSLEYSGKTIEGEATFKAEPTNYEGSLRLTTPYAAVNSLTVTGAHSRSSAQKTGRLDIMHNGQQRLDFDYTYGSGAARVDMRRPYPMASSVNMRGAENDATVNWDTTRSDSSVRLDLNMKAEAATKELMAKLTLPSRVVGVTTSYSKTPETLTHSAEVMWDDTPRTRASYSLEATKSVRRGENLYDGRLTLNSPVWDLATTFNHRAAEGRRYTTEVSVQQMAVRSELTLNNPGFQHTLTATHPRLPNNLQLTTEGSTSNKVYDGKVELKYDTEVFTYTGRVADESSYSEKKYTARTSLTHQGSNLEVIWAGEVKDNSESRSANMEASYLTSYDSQRKTASMRAEINKLRNSLDMQIITPIKTLGLVATEATHSDSLHSFEIVGSMDEHSVRGDFNINTDENMVELKVYQDEGDYVHAYAQLGSSKAIAEVYRMVSGNRHQEAMAKVALSDDQLVSTRFFLCPRMTQEIQMVAQGFQQSTVYRRMARQVASSWEDESRKKTRQLTRAVDAFTPVARTLAREYEAVSTQMAEAYNRMYAEDQFYLQTISTYLAAQTAELRTNMAARWASWAEQRQQMAADFWTRYEHSIRVMETWAARAGAYILETRPYWEKVAKTTKDFTMNTIEKVKSNPALNWMWEKINSVEIMDLVNPAESYMEQLMKKYEPQINRMKMMWSKVEARPEYQYVKAYAIRTWQKSVWAVRYMELDARLRELIREVSDISLATYRSQLIGKVREYLQLERDAWTVWNPQEGEIGFDLYWPFHWDDIKHLPRIKKIDTQKYIDMAKDLIEEYRPHPEWSVYDFYYKYKPSMDVFNWIPPFKTRATIMGSQHYMTFDRRFYEFAGECSYLLARDFIDGRFSVVVNYEQQSGRPVKKSLTVISNDKQIEVFPDGQVLVDGSRVEMPLAFANTSIFRTGSLIRVDNTLGLTVDCNLAHDRCTVNVSGWYYGKTGGMFGTYNNEANDDFTTAEHTRVARPEQLADSWTAGRRCRPQNYATETAPTPGSNPHRLCAALFEDASSLMRPCYKIVDPAPFMTMCLNDMPVSENRLMTERDTCKAAAFYVDECRREGVNVRVPGPCVRCEVESLNTEMTEGMNQTLQGDDVPQSADVVFVIEHSDCNRDVVSKIAEFVTDLEQAFKLEGMKNSRYSVVGYGGEGVMGNAHTHTMNGAIFNSPDKLLLALEGFEAMKSGNADGLEALAFASRLPFRAGVGKTIIMIPCSACGVSGVSYADVQQVLMQKNIHVHMLMQHNFQLTVNKEDPVSAYIFGADKTRVYTRKDAGGQEVAGDTELRTQLQMPKDLCVALTTDTDGSVFNTLQWSQARPYMQKRFVDVMVRVFADKGHPETCQQCDCVADENGVGRAVCKSCVSTRSFYSFLPGFGSSSEETREVIVPQGSQENTRELRTLRRKNLRRQRQQQA